MTNTTTTHNSPERVPLIELINQPDILEKQMLEDALVALEAIRNEIAEKGFVNTQKSQAFVSLTKLVKTQLDAQREARESPADAIKSIVDVLPFHEEGVDTVTM